MRITLLQKGFDKSYCRNGYGKGDDYQLESWFLTERFFDSLVEHRGIDEAVRDLQDRAARHHRLKK